MLKYKSAVCLVHCQIITIVAVTELVYLFGSIQYFRFICNDGSVS